jgi:hypothetical protein
VSFCSDEGTVSYSMLGPGAGMCERIGRLHRSNKVFFLADFGTGRFCQKCHDPECWGYRSPWMPLPEGVWRRGRLQELVDARAAAAAAAAAIAIAALSDAPLALPAPEGWAPPGGGGGA